MADKKIWSNHDTVDYLSGLEEDQLKAELKGYEFDDEMVNSTPIDSLREIVRSDDVFSWSDTYKFENDIIPLLTKTSEDGMITLSDGEHEDIIPPDEVLDSDLINGCAGVELYEGPEGYYFLCDDGKKVSVVSDIAESLQEEVIDEAKDLDAIDDELKELKADYDDFGADGFYSVPFKQFKKEFPEFTKQCILKYLKSMEILTDKELEDKDLLEKYWASGELIIKEDWPILFKGANIMLNGKTAMWDKLWSSQYSKMRDAEEEN